MRKIKIVLGVVLIILVLTPIIYVQANKIIYANRVLNYLIEEKKYSKEEISVRGIWGKKLPSFYAIVVFNDEPDVEYVYFAHNNVLQFEYRLTEDGKAKGITQSKLKHYFPFK
ncbi:DUF3139 domain-containing protein [Paenibacillus sp. KN14-4R]|uniref:DUF3139 domain-containing protein n=1 Tax=Paenibacillus sp. KN14-4R TaxID=3445773 RepID=UPI003FA010A2